MTLTEMHFVQAHTSFVRSCPPCLHFKSLKMGAPELSLTLTLLIANLFLPKDCLNPVSGTITRHVESQCVCTVIPRQLPSPYPARKPPWSFISLFLENQNPTRAVGPLNLPFMLGNAHTGTRVSRVALRGRQFSGLRTRKINSY